VLARAKSRDNPRAAAPAFDPRAALNLSATLDMPASYSLRAPHAAAAPAP
jgi:hypothetical protein